MVWDAEKIDGVGVDTSSVSWGGDGVSIAASELSSEVEIRGKTRGFDSLRGVDEGRMALGGGEGLSWALIIRLAMAEEGSGRRLDIKTYRYLV